MRTTRFLSLMGLLAVAACASESVGPSEASENGAAVTAPRSGGSSGTRANGPKCEGQTSPLVNLVEEPAPGCSR
ncbi:MAG: hypothetical protein MUC69_01140 [Gemmatimonadales bacterium]|jgi:hypothetical protein|nr:hypothetical protein [Gemmatimonadales bacterium]